MSKIIVQRLSSRDYTVGSLFLITFPNGEEMHFTTPTHKDMTEAEEEKDIKSIGRMLWEESCRNKISPIDFWNNFVAN
jgi:hypothetical protein